MKYRVERCCTDYGYGDGWAVLRPDGTVLVVRSHWLDAYQTAHAVAGILSLVRGR